jgi:hypothetical protein
MRKHLTFLIALASIAFGVCSPASAAQALDGSNQNQVKRALQAYLCNLSHPRKLIRLAINIIDSAAT